MPKLNLKSKIRAVPNWPKNGMVFWDITPLWQEAKYFRYLIDEMARPYLKKKIDLVVGIDARGFILAAGIAYKLKIGLAVVRKKGKLPYKTVSQKYSLEYASNTIEMHRDAIKPKERVLIVDDVLATGGTMKATINLIKKLKGEIVGISFLTILDYLDGEKKLKGYPIKTLLRYSLAEFKKGLKK